MSAEKTIAPMDLRDYLVKVLGWTLLEEALRDRLFVFSNPDHPRRQLAYPMDSSAPDYQEAVDGVMEKLAELTQQHPETLLARAQAIKDDVIRLRVSFPGNDQSLPLDFAATWVRNTEKLLKAAACTVLRPLPHHPRLSLAEATQLVDKARFQQTEPGSFILKVACPVMAMDAQGSLDFDGENTPFVRRVTWTLRQSLVKLASAIEQDQLPSLVEEMKTSPAPVISSNLCEALAAMHDEKADNTLDVDFAWSALHAPPARAGDLRRVRFQGDYFGRIEEVRRELRGDHGHREDTFIGTVERLDGIMDETGRRSGDVLLSLLLPDEDETVQAKVNLSSHDYAKAYRAHAVNGAYVRVKGRLLPGRRLRQLTQVSRFDLIGDGQEATDGKLGGAD